MKNRPLLVDKQRLFLNKVNTLSPPTVWSQLCSNVENSNTHLGSFSPHSHSVPHSTAALNIPDCLKLQTFELNHRFELRNWPLTTNDLQVHEEDRPIINFTCFWNMWSFKNFTFEVFVKTSQIFVILTITKLWLLSLCHQWLSSFETTKFNPLLIWSYHFV